MGSLCLWLLYFCECVIFLQSYYDGRVTANVNVSHKNTCLRLLIIIIVIMRLMFHDDVSWSCVTSLK